MPAEDERGSVVAIQDWSSLATCRVSFTSILTWRDLIRYCGPKEVEDLLVWPEDELELCEDELSGACTGALAGADEPAVVPAPQAASKRASITRIPRLPWRAIRLRCFLG